MFFAVKILVMVKQQWHMLAASYCAYWQLEPNLQQLGLGLSGSNRKPSLAALRPEEGGDWSATFKDREQHFVTLAKRKTLRFFGMGIFFVGKECIFF